MESLIEKVSCTIFMKHFWSFLGEKNLNYKSREHHCNQLKILDDMEEQNTKSLKFWWNLVCILTPFFDSMASLIYLRSVKSEKCLDVSGKVSHCWLKYRQIKVLIEKVRLYYVSLETFDHFFEDNLNHQSREPNYPSKKSSMTWRKMKLKCWTNLGYILKPFLTGWSDLLVLSTIWEIVRYSGKRCSSFVLLPENDIINQKIVS